MLTHIDLFSGIGFGGKMPRGQKPKIYPEEIVSEVRRLYLDNYTQAEIAAKLYVTQKVIWRLMLRHGLKSRTAIKRNQIRENNSSWKADKAGYQALHLRLSAKFGRPKRCDECGTTDPDRRYDWANLTGHYEDENDYKRMCRSCHWKHDKKHLNFHGATGARRAGDAALCRD